MDKLIEEYIKNNDLIKMSLDDYGAKKKVKKINEIGSELLNIVDMIEEKDAETKQQFFDLMDSENEDLRSRVAHNILDRMHVDKAIRIKALSIIKNRIENTQDPAERMGNQMWLKDYFKDHPEDQE